MVGLDAAGKTTILYKLKLGEIVTTIPTIGQSPAASRGRAYDLIWPIETCRIQRRNRGVQEHLLHRVGCRRAGQDPSSLAALLPGGQLGLQYVKTLLLRTPFYF